MLTLHNPVSGLLKLVACPRNAVLGLCPQKQLFYFLIYFLLFSLLVIPLIGLDGLRPGRSKSILVKSIVIEAWNIGEVGRRVYNGIICGYSLFYHLRGEVLLLQVLLKRCLALASRSLDAVRRSI